MLYAYVYRVFCIFVDVMCMGFVIGFADMPPLVAVCVCFWFSCVFNAMFMGFFIAFADKPPLVAICVGSMCMGFLIGFAHRSALVQISTYNRNS